MNEQELFLSALEIDDPAERQVHLREKCADDADLLARVESLLASHDSQSRFLNTPVVDQVAGEPLHNSDATTLDRGGSARDEEFQAPSADEHDSELMTEYHDDSSASVPLGYLETSQTPGSLGKLGHYEIQEVVGRGAFGTVLKGFDEKLHRVVAIKVMAPEMAVTSPARKRFLREARSSAAVRHDNVVSIYAVDETPIPYLVMEYIPGTTLQQRLDECGPLELTEVLRLGKQIADGLAAAHSQQLIHRDVKPGNILLDTSINDHVKITDFGLARAADDASLTQSGMIAGTPLYMAPEQAMGKKLDQRADLFSFGSVLYQMLTGRPPFRAPNTLAVLKRVTEDTPRPVQEIIPEVPDWMCEIVSRLHEKDPERRFDSAKQVGYLLEHCINEVEQGRFPDIAAIKRPPASPEYQTSEFATGRSSRSSRTVVAAVMLLIAGFGVTEATGVSRLTSSVIRLATGSGTLVIETDDPNVTVAIDGEDVTVSGAGVRELTLRPGKHKVSALKNGQQIRQELVSITRNGRVVVRMTTETESSVAKSADTDATREKLPLFPPGSSAHVLTSGDYEWSEPLNLGSAVNSDSDDGDPHLSADGRTLYFGSNRTGDWSIWTSTRDSIDSPWLEATRLPEPVNGTGVDAGHPQLSSDALELFFHSHRESGSNTDIWMSTRESAMDNWQTPVRLGLNVNTDDHREEHPTLLEDELSLIFMSDRSGEAKLWLSRRESRSSEWLPAAPVEMPQNENLDIPEAARDGLSLLFVKWGEGYDVGLAVSGRTSLAETWSEPRSLNLSHGRHCALSADSHSMIFSSEKLLDSFGHTDLWVSRRVRHN